VAVIVALAVCARVMVAALVNWNDIVKVIDAVRRLRTGAIGHEHERGHEHHRF
jgi:hypothetical protein